MAWGLLAAGISFFLGAGGLACLRARRELPEHGSISTPTFVLGFTAYFGHGITTLTACLLSAGALGIPWPARLVGVPLLVAGAAFVLIARRQFHSFKQTWALETPRLVTGGIYAWSRNPQIVGGITCLTGAALLGDSAVGLALVATQILGTLIWLPTEERFLVQRFGAEYEAYRERSPRLLGLPRATAGGELRENERRGEERRGEERREDVRRGDVRPRARA